MPKQELNDHKKDVRIRNVKWCAISISRIIEMFGKKNRGKGNGQDSLGQGRETK